MHLRLERLLARAPRSDGNRQSLDAEYHSAQLPDCVFPATNQIGKEVELDACTGLWLITIG